MRSPAGPHGGKVEAKLTKHCFFAFDATFFVWICLFPGQSPVTRPQESLRSSKTLAWMKNSSAVITKTMFASARWLHINSKRENKGNSCIPGCSHRLQHFIYESGNPRGLQRLRQEDGARGGVQEQGDVQRGKAVLRDQRGEEQQGGEQQLCRQRQRIDSRAQRHHLRHHHDINSGSDYEMKVIESSFQEELCICEGSQCNPSSPTVSLSIVLLFSTVVVTLWNGWFDRQCLYFLQIKLPWMSN